MNKKLKRNLNNRGNKIDILPDAKTIRKKIKNQGENHEKIVSLNMRAMERGLSYGQYVAMVEHPNRIFYIKCKS